MSQDPFYPITVYSTSTYLIHYTMTAQAGTEDDLLGEDEDWIMGSFDAADYYIDADTLDPVPLKQYELTIEANRLAGIPPGTVVFVGGVRVTMDEDDDEIVFDLPLPQTVHVTLSNPYYQPLDDMIEVPCTP